MSPAEKLNEWRRSCHLRGTALPTFASAPPPPNGTPQRAQSPLDRANAPLWPKGLFARMIGKQIQGPSDWRLTD